MVEIIIIKYCNKEIEEACINSVLKFTDAPYNLRIHDNYPKNENIGKLWNRLISQSSDDYICLLNSDTVVEPGWLKKLLEVFDHIEGAGVAGPSTDHSHNQQCKTIPEGETFVDFGERFPLWDLSGFCLVFPKKVWEEVEGFPEDFGFYGQEVIFVDKVVDQGYKQIWRTDVFVHHEGSSSLKAAVRRGEQDEEGERKLSREKVKQFRENKNN